MMRCEAFEDLLHPWLDGFLDEAESEKMRAHAAQCPSCALRVQALREALDTFAAAGPEAEVPSEAAAAWRQAVRAEAERAGVTRLADRRMTAGRLRRAGGWAVSVAAGLLFLLGGARLVHEGVLGWPRERASAPKQEMAAPLQSARQAVLEEAPEADDSQAKAGQYSAGSSHELAYEEYAAEPGIGGASAADSVRMEPVAPMAEAEMNQALDEEAPEESVSDNAVLQAAPSSVATQAPSAPNAQAPAGQLEQPALPHAASDATAADGGGSGFAHYLLDMATFAMMSLPLVVAAGIVCVILRRIRRKRAGENAEK